ncbi:uncharacterized protein FIBRA_02932 [Fibroporia radiculosa]|uniref:Phospholipid/glycerol acyltransferase domain-containing protein n=1 Tax=Fibroporia radiculosa TaxID=599839 RepID=J4I9B8_9APHY|nr:uncharacterized protein FIBRA_02932 [Fibroporia radiculosa]CCM00886.1 predicted protein [Fibroporia radiculosa]
MTTRRQHQPGLHNLEIRQRPRHSWLQTVWGALFLVVFLFACVVINASQFVFLLPLKLFPFAWADAVYFEGIRCSKGAFGALIVLMSQLFAPTKLMITFEKEGQGRLTDEEIDALVERGKGGRVVGLHLPQRAVLIANHQVYADWWYDWSLAYFMGTHKDVYIVLKDSLKWIPIIGWGMQLFKFVFLKRSWASDRLHLSNSLSWLGRQAEKRDVPLMFILYPEGTLVSKDTRPLSKKFADKMGIPDMMHTLLPRSTGLHYSLRSLSPRVPTLRLIDITMAYPGIPPFGYGQSYYTLRSIFLDGVPPPTIHMHIRCFDVAREVPIGDLSASNPNALPTSSPGEHTLEVEIPEAERDRFDLWLRNLWREKDRLLSQYLDTGSFVGTKELQLNVPLILRRRRDLFDALGLFMPVVVFWAWWRLI